MSYAKACDRAIGIMILAIAERLEDEKDGSSLSAEDLIRIFNQNLTERYKLFEGNSTFKHH